MQTSTALAANLRQPSLGFWREQLQ